MTGAEISFVLWGITTMGSVVGVFFKTRSDIRHLEDTKETKNGLSSKVDVIKLKVELANQKLDEQGHKISILFDKLPCLQPGWDRDKC